MPHHNSRALFGILLLACFIYTLVAQICISPYGRADNGDFTRSMRGYVEKPVGFQENWPKLDRKDPASVRAYRERFFEFYLPYWVISTEKPVYPSFKHSVHLLWMPGFYLNKALFSERVLDLKYLGMLPRLLLLGALFAILTLLYRKQTGLAASFFLSVCLTLIFNDAHYLSYFNSFLQETGALVFITLMLFGFMLLIEGHYHRSLGVLLASLVLFSTAKPQYCVSSLALGVLLLLAFNAPFFWNRPLRWTRGRALFTGLVFLALLGSSLYSSTVYDKHFTTLAAGHRYFSGVLYFSRNPVEHLVRAGFKPEDAKYVGQYTVPLTFKYRMSDTLGVIAREPVIPFKYIGFAAQSMQDVQHPQLGITSPHTRTFGYARIPFSFWSELKTNHFPRGGLFIALECVILFACLALLVRVKDTRWRRLVLVILLLNLATWIEIGTCLGDGIMDMVKHLYAANLFFDFQLALAGFALLQSGVMWRQPGPGVLMLPPEGRKIQEIL